MARKAQDMQEHADVPVAVLSSRPSLDLAINIWVPGYVASSAKDVDAVIDLTDEGGVIVIDLGDANGPEFLRSLHERQIDTPTVVVNVGDRELDPEIARDVVVADSTQVADLTNAFEAARRRRTSRPAVVAEEPAEPERLVEAAPVPAPTPAPTPAPAPVESVEPGEPAAPEPAAEHAEPVVSEPAPEHVVEDEPEEQPGPPLPPAAVFEAPPQPPPTPTTAATDSSGWVDGGVAPTAQPEEGAAPAGAERRGTSAAVPALYTAGRGRRAGREQDRPAEKGPRWWPFGSRRGSDQERGDEQPAAETSTPQGRGVAADAPGPGDTSLLFNDGSGEPVHLIDLTDPLFERDEPADERIIRLEPETDAKVSIDPVVVGRSWIALDELEDVIGSGSAVVAVRATDASYAIVAGVGLAPFEADRLIGANHPLLREVRREGWAIRAHSTDEESAPPPPLAECDELLAIAVPRGGHEVDGVVLIGRFVSFTDDEVRAARAIVGDTERLDERLRRLQTPTARPAVMAPESGPFVPAAIVRAGWRLLDELYPLLGGAAAVVALEGDHTVYVPTAAVGVDAQVAARFIPADHPLLAHVRDRGGKVHVQAANEGYGLVGGLPLPTQPFVVAITVGPPERDGGVVLFARQRRFTDDELAILASAIHGHRLAELVRARRGRRVARAAD